MNDFAPYLERLSCRLEYLPHRLRVAFAAGCAERVLRIYELDYNATDCRPHAAVELAWKFACGEQVSTELITSTEAAVGDATPNIELEGDEYSGPMSASVSTIYALYAITDHTTKAASDAARCAIEAVQSFEDYSGEGAKAEKQWQENALDLVESWGDRPISQGMFAPIGGEPPVWFPWRGQESRTIAAH
ncbi:MAG: hypothetical protein O7E52_19195 [Candidatus Poribacteria bacterium]|nr:hypothetical protein [Candidatus Poribacteria bacterium]